MYLYGKNVEKSFSQNLFKTITMYDLSSKTFQLQSKFCPQNFICPCPWDKYMYKIVYFFLQNQESFGAESWYIAWRTQGLTKFVQMMTVG